MNGQTNEKPFVFRQFEVKHHLCAHKVGFDGVLLGAWANFSDSTNILDLGTGCGLIALMAAQTNHAAHITGIEIDKPSAQQAAENFARSPWAQRLQLVQADFTRHHFENKFDHLLTNPPFYVNRVGAKGHQRQAARHFSDEQLQVFIQKTKDSLAPGGRFSLVVPWREWQGFKTNLLDAGYWIQRECVVFTRNPEIPERVLIECVQHKCEKQNSTLNIYTEDGKYSAEYSKLTAPFYL